MRKVMAVAASFALAACGADPGVSPSLASPSGGTTSGPPPGGTTGASSSNCVALAGEYVDAFKALACDPAADPCGAWRPLAIRVGSSVTDAVLTGTLCWVGGAGYVSAAGAVQLDAVLARFAAAGSRTAPASRGMPPAASTAARGSPVADRMFP